MHELLAPLLYVFHVDLKYLSKVQGQYENYFNDEFDETSFPERDMVSNCRLKKATDWDASIDGDSFRGSTAKVGSLDELDPETRDIFMEHDAFCMFDSLMNGARGVVAMADFFSPSPAIGSSTGVPPVIEASSALYYLLSIVDSSLHSHFVEPQYFALRWLRVPFGREFSLEDLLVIWDELFSSPNSTCTEDDTDYSFRILCFPRGTFISAMAVSMILHIRSALLATENATSCLQRLLNFPKNINVNKLIEKAKSLQALALEINIPSSSQGSSNKNKPTHSRGYSLSSASVSPDTPLHPVPDSYWEEKWRVSHREEALKKGGLSEKISRGMIKGLLVERFSLSRTESDPSPAKSTSGKKDARSSVRRRLLGDLSREVDSDADISKPECDEDLDLSHSKECPVDVGKHFPDEQADQIIAGRTSTSGCMAEETCLSGENSSVFSIATSLHSAANDDENDSENSCVTSNSFVADDNDEEIIHVEEPCSNNSENSLLQDSETVRQNSETASTVKHGPDIDEAPKQETMLKERKPLSGKFQWFWKFGRGSGEGNMEKGGSADAQSSSDTGNIRKGASGSNYDSNSCGDSVKVEAGDKNVMGTLKNLGQSMLENIQVIESVFQQDMGKGQVAAMSAFKELRKISNLLSEM